VPASETSPAATFIVPPAPVAIAVLLVSNSLLLRERTALASLIVTAPARTAAVPNVTVYAPEPPRMNSSGHALLLKEGDVAVDPATAPQLPVLFQVEDEPFQVNVLVAAI
jgi:hypothetical protein